MNITEFTFRRPVTTIMFFVSLLLIGLIGGRLLPLAFFPDIDFPGFMIQIPYPGSTPEEVERVITQPAEEVLATIGGITRMISDSNENGATLVLFLNWGEGVVTKSMEAKEKLDGIRSQFPDDVDRILMTQFSTTTDPIMNFRISSERDLSDAYDMLNRVLKRRIERLDGVSSVNLYGINKREIQIDMDMDRIIAHNIDLPRLVQDLQQSNFMVTAGRITDRDRRYTVRPIGEIADIEQIENMLITGTNLHLRDIANVKYESPKLDYGRHLDRTYAVGLDVFKAGGANTVDVARRAEAEVLAAGELPEMQGINIVFLHNQAEGIVTSLNELMKAGALGAVLAFMVLYLFLRRIETTAIVALAVPTSLAISLGGMYFLGMSLNILSMMGLMLAVGMLVDNAVVITENIHRRQLLEGSSPEVVKSAVKEVALAVTAGTFTTAIVFLPNIISPRDETSLLLKYVAIPITIALAVSLVIAQTIVPMLAARVKIKAQTERKITVIDKLQKRYAKLLRWTLDHHRLAILLIVVIIGTAAIPISVVNTEMYEEEASKRLRLHYYVNGVYPLKKVENTVDVIEDYLYSNQERFEIKSVYTYYQKDYAMSTIYLEDDLDKGFDEIKEMIQEELPIITIGQPSLERRRFGSGDESVSINLVGKSSELLAQLSIDVAKHLQRMPGLENVRSSAESGDDEVHVVINRERARHYGLSTRQIAQTLSTAMRGLNLPRLRDEQGEIDVRLRFKPDDERTMMDLRNLPVSYEGRNPITLASVADFQIRKGPRNIHREDRITSMRVNANLGADVTIMEAREKITLAMENYRFPAGYSWTFGRAFRDEDETGKNMMVNTLLALVLIYFVMAALFESLIFPAAIWSSILFAVIGVWWFFMITGTTFSLIAWIGVLILMGVVVNNGIVLLDHVNQLRAGGMKRKEAIIQAGHDRLRAIIMTAATTVLGLIPLAVSNTQIGGDGPPYYPMARAIVGGLTFSTVVTLLILPTIYIILDDMRAWTRRIIKEASAT